MNTTTEQNNGEKRIFKFGSLLILLFAFLRLRELMMTIMPMRYYTGLSPISIAIISINVLSAVFMVLFAISLSFGKQQRSGLYATFIFSCSTIAMILSSRNVLFYITSGNSYDAMLGVGELIQSLARLFAWFLIMRYYQKYGADGEMPLRGVAFLLGLELFVKLFFILVQSTPIGISTLITCAPQILLLLFGISNFRERPIAQSGVVIKWVLIGFAILLVISFVLNDSNPMTSYYIDSNGNGKMDRGEHVYTEDSEGTEYWDLDDDIWFDFNTKDGFTD